MADKFILGFPISEKTASSVMFQDGTNVGIGTASPAYLLDMESTATGLTHNLKLNKTPITDDYAEIAFQLWSGAGTGLNTFGGSGTSRPGVVLRAVNENASTAAGAFVVGTFSGGADNTNLTEKFRISSDGNVGIGTDSPSAKLKIEGNAATNGLSIKSAANTGTYPFMVTWSEGTEGDAFCVDSNLNVGIGTNSPDSLLHIESTLDTSSPIFTIENDDAKQIELGVVRSVAGTNPNTSFLAYDDDLRFIAGSGTTNEVVRIKSDGNVGIGTTTVDDKLHILGDSTKIQQQGQGGITLKFNHGNNASINSDINIANIKSFVSSGSSGSEGGGLAFETKPTSGAATERMRITSGGNVGIGTDNPQNTLHLGDNTNTLAGTLRIDSFVANQFWKIEPGTNTLNIKDYDGTALQSFDGANNYVLFNGGNVGIGTTSPNAKLHAVGTASNIKAVIEAQSTNAANSFFNAFRAKPANGDNSAGSGLWLGANNQTSSRISTGASYYSAGQWYTQASYSIMETTNGDFKIFTGAGATAGLNTPVERMRITSGGNLLLGITNEAAQPTAKNFFIADYQSGASITVGGHSGTHTAVLFRHNGATTPGSIVITSNTTSYNETSDYRLKEDLQDFNGLDMISNIPVYDFKWKSEDSRAYGVMAHELQEVLPQAVSGEKDATEEYEITPAVLDEEGNVSEEAVMGTRDDTQGVDYSKIVPLLVKSIQELKAEIELLKLNN